MSTRKKSPPKPKAKSKAPGPKTSLAKLQPPKQNSIEAVLMPSEVFAEVVKVLSGLPYNEVGNLLNTIVQYQPQKIQVN